MGNSSTAAIIGDMLRDSMGTLNIPIAGKPPLDSPTINAANASNGKRPGVFHKVSTVGISKYLSHKRQLVICLYFANPVGGYVCRFN